MSVIPIIIATNKGTVVCNKNDFYSNNGRDGDLVLIENIDKKQFEELRNPDSQDANTSYDLTVGREYIDLLDKSKHGITENNPLELRPGSAAIIETTEYVHFPRSRFGHIVPKVSRLHEGLSNTSSKVDPGYEGKLAIAVFNLGQNTITLNKGDKFCTLYILSVDTGREVRPYQKEAKSLPPGLPRKNIKQVLTLVNENSWISILLSIISLSISILTLALSLANTFKLFD
ncbi:dCTP deaminase domain-containing protein [Archangium gephyra]|uniref:dCTP deaminase domain-containing protein n=1 Tax=Archangium gephyra TaxID=48 RepID=UPI0009E444C6|nr:hypothetical protein [Archangium gephyra]